MKMRLQVPVFVAIPIAEAAFIAACLLLVFGSVVAAESPAPAAGESIDSCGTMRDWKAKGIARPGVPAGGCPIQGGCDLPSLRNSFIPIPGQRAVTVRLQFNIFRLDDGTDPASTLGLIAAQLLQLNADFLPYKIKFEASDIKIIDDSRFRSLNDNDPTEVDTMKFLYAGNPLEQCNVYIVGLQSNVAGSATFPWDPMALSVFGGILVDNDAFGFEQKTMTHLLGHTLGLWHTHRGVSEVGACTPCYERADGANGDTTGDYCSDTPPTPLNFGCLPPGGVDGCSDVLWGPTQPRNYMSSAPDSCYNQFSNQQNGRMLCWLHGLFSSWIIPFCPTAISAECCESVCGARPSCCTGWDEGCVDLWQSLCTGCGNPRAGSCFHPNGTEGCDDQQCCQAVCNLEIDCCDGKRCDTGPDADRPCTTDAQCENASCVQSTWGGLCAGLAVQHCWNCGHSGAGSCHQANGTPGCDDFTCCSDVCKMDPFCCEVAWDDFCAQGVIGVCRPPNNNCENALLLTDAETPFYNINGSGGGGFLCRDNGICRDIFYDHIADFNGDLRVRAIFESLPRPPTFLVAYDGCGCPVNDADLIECDFGFTPGGAFVTIPVVEGQCYKLRIAGPSNCEGGLGTIGLTRFYPVCGEPSAGSCVEANGTAGCDNNHCCDLVCNVDASCCEAGWGASCTSLATDLCSPLPANDDCINAIPIPEGLVGFSNSLTTSDGPSPCNIGRDIWYRYVPGVSGTLTASLCDSSFDTVIAIYDGCTCQPNIANLLACNDNVCGTRSELILPVVEGNCYLIQVGGAGGVTGGGRLNLFLETDDSGSDDCEDAPRVTFGNYPFTTENASADGPDNGPCDDIFPDIWWDYIPASTGLATLSLCDDADYDTKLAVYEGCHCPANVGDTLDCDDDACTSVESEVTVPVVEGGCYKIQLGGFDHDTGVGTLVITEDGFANCGDPAAGSCFTANGSPGCENADCCVNVCADNPSCCTTEWDAACAALATTDCAEPFNDYCIDSLPIDLGATPFSNVSATSDGPSPCGDLGSDIWYKYTADFMGPLTVSTCGSGFDTALAIYDGCTCRANEANLLDCNDDSCGLQSSVASWVEIGNCYLIQAGGFDAAQGNGTITLAACSPTLGDLNNDNTVSLLDYPLFQDCVTGPAIEIGPECGCADLNHDRRVDLLDFGLFQSNNTGG
ncbi:MAG: hypothetical protein V3W34_18910 [Phycisphaerae bacterium]